VFPFGTNVVCDSREIASLKRAPSASKTPLAFIASVRSRFDPTCLIAATPDAILNSERKP